MAIKREISGVDKELKAYHTANSRMDALIGRLREEYDAQRVRLAQTREEQKVRAGDACNAEGAAC